jgi:hypothetical protein
MSIYTQAYNYIEPSINNDQRGLNLPIPVDIVAPIDFMLSSPELASSDVSRYLINNPDVLVALPHIFGTMSSMIGKTDIRIEEDYEDPTKEYLVFRANFSGAEEEWLKRWEELATKIYEVIPEEIALKIHVILDLANK